MKNDYIANVEYFRPQKIERPALEIPTIPQSPLDSLGIQIDVKRYPQTKVREIHIKDVSIELESE